MTDTAIERYEAMDTSAHIDDRGATGTITVLTRSGPVAISMKRIVMEQLRYHIERALNENPVPVEDTDREIS